MYVGKVIGGEGYAAKLYRMQLERTYFENIHRRQNQFTQDVRQLEANKLVQFTEAQRLLRNQMMYKHYKDTELYEFQCRALKLARDKHVRLGTKVDVYS
jgi:hypothetical protein